MKQLGERNSILLCEGANITGTFRQAFQYSFENLYTDQSEILNKFCAYIDDKIGGAGSKNIEGLFLSFMNPNDANHQKFAENIKNRISEIKNRSQI